MKIKSLVKPLKDPNGYGTGIVLEIIENKSFVFFPSVGKTIGFLTEWLLPSEFEQGHEKVFADIYEKFVASGKPATDFYPTQSYAKTNTTTKSRSSVKKKAPKITVIGGLKGLVELFINKTKGGFRGEIFLNSERAYRIKASENFLTHFNQQVFSTNLQQGCFLELAQKAMYMIHKKNNGFNSVSDQYRTWTHHKEAVCGNEEDSRIFCVELYELLYGVNKAVHFDNIVQCFSKNNRPDWAVPTAFLSLLDYHKYLCIKPGFIRQTCNNIGIEFMGSGGKNWATYEKFLEFGSWLKSEIAKIPNSTLPADADMLDMQAFIYAVSKEFEY